LLPFLCANKFNLNINLLIDKYSSQNHQVVDLNTDTSFKRDVVENELMKNVHLIGAMCVGDINTCMDFFDQSFVRYGQGEQDEEPVTP
jgi:predicted transport protein